MASLNLVLQRVHVLKVRGTIREMHFDFLCGRRFFADIF